MIYNQFNIGFFIIQSMFSWKFKCYFFSFEFLKPMILFKNQSTKITY